MRGAPRLVYYRGVWCAYWREGGRPRRVSLGVSEKAQAEQALKDWSAEQQRRRPAETVAEIVELYLQDAEKRVARPKALRSIWQVAAKTTFGGLRPEHVTRDLCRDYAAKRLALGYSAGTVRKELSTMLAALRWKDPNTPAVVELPSPPPPRMRHLTHVEAEALLAGCAQPHVKLFVTLALTTAARAGAILDLQWAMVDFNRGRIDFGRAPTATKGRSITPMNESARAALVAAREGAQSEYVIEYAGRNVGSIKKGFAAACARAGLRGVSPHTLRHTAAVWMAEAGLPMVEIAQYMGHSSPAVTFRVYGRFSPEYLSKAAAALELPGTRRVHLGTRESSNRKLKA